MNIDNIHTPERLEGETMDQYRARRRMSKRLQERGTLLVSAASGPVKAPEFKLLRRKAVKQVGARQVKRLVRKYREAQSLGLTSEEGK